MKIHHPDPRVNRQRVEAVKKALGDDVRLMVDVNQRLDVLGNIRQAQLLEDLDLVWYEEPVLADDTAACAEVARAIKIPVATGENNYSRFEFRELIERRAARYLMPDVCRANGFSETMKIARLAAAHQVARLAPRGPRAVAAGRGAHPERLPRRVHELGAGRPLRWACPRARTASSASPTARATGSRWRRAPSRKYRVS